MNQTQKKFLLTVLLITTPVVGGLAYLLLFSVVIGPLFLDNFGKLPSQILTSFFTLLAMALYWKMVLRENLKKKYGIRTENETAFNRKWLLLLFSVLAFAMAPFGFAGMLESRGNGMLPPLWGGNLCLGAGISLLYFYFCR